MKTDNKLTKVKPKTTVKSGTHKMTISSKKEKEIFKIFTSGIYSNPIGTVVREITSNCFDSHVEEGVNTPVLVKLSQEADGKKFVSFIDYGVGMSPDRVTNIYGVYFETTKDQTNDQIGGFGIGGKTPLAYKRSTGHGEGEYDNSFFCITKYNGTKYIWNIFEGEESPEFNCMHEEPTDERNGTEIRIPILDSHVSDFERELELQLYYFENLYFEGFSDNVSNDYKIIRGKEFLYRGNAVSNNMHVCLGKVAYPIKYETLGLSEYDYQIPVALNVPIGDIGVVTSREALDYSEKTIKYLKKKLEAVKNELKGLLAKQYDNVQTLEDYFKVTNQFGTLYLSDTIGLDVKEIITPSDVDYSNYKFSFMKTPNDRQLLDLLFNVKVYGAKESKTTGYYRRRRHTSTNYHQLTRSYDGIQEADNVYFVEDYQKALKRVKQAYLRNEHGRFYIISPNEDFTFFTSKISDMFKAEYDATTKDGIALTTTMVQMQDQYMDIIRKHCTDYEAVDVPQEFVDAQKRPRLSEDIKNSTVPVKVMGDYSKHRVKISELIAFNGVIFYATADYETQLNRAKRVYEALYGEKHLSGGYDSYYKSFGDQKGVMFLMLAKNNIKYMEYCKKAKPISEFYYSLVHRKADTITNYFKNHELVQQFANIPSLYKLQGFEKVSPEWADSIQKISTFVEQIGVSGKKNIRDIQYQKDLFSNYLQLDNIELNEEDNEIREELEMLKAFKEQNSEILRWINCPSYSSDSVSDALADILKKVMVF